MPHPFEHIRLLASQHGTSMTSPYNSVVFCAYVVPTIPFVDEEVGDPNGPGFVGGRYVGLDDPKEDISARFQLVAAAALQLYDLATETRDDPSVLHIFCVPEFFFRGKTGAYEPAAHHDLREHALGVIKSFSDDPKFENWMFVLGTALENDTATATTQVQQEAKQRDALVQAIVKAYEAAEQKEYKDFCFDLLTKTTEFAQSHPLVVVRNKCILYKPNSKEFPKGLTVDKRYISHEDFVLSYYTPAAYSEMSVAYPTIDEDEGELKQQCFDNKSIFTLAGITFGVEICLDHRRARLRKVREENKETGAVPIDVQLVISCGMQLQQPSIVARSGAPVFNCDGQYAKIGPGDLPDENSSIFTGSKDGKAHTQLTIVKQEASGPERNAMLERPKNDKVQIAALRVPPNLDPSKVEAYGAGEVHLYSKCVLPNATSSRK